MASVTQCLEVGVVVVVAVTIHVIDLVPVPPALAACVPIADQYLKADIAPCFAVGVQRPRGLPVHYLPVLAAYRLALMGWRSYWHRGSRIGGPVPSLAHGHCVYC
jgi:hypothetical protein